jgi:Zn-dependent M28 family amino/carboxypeptidase
MRLITLVCLAISLGANDISYAEENVGRKSAIEIQNQQKVFVSNFIKAVPSRGTRKQRRHAAAFLIKELEEAGLPVERHSYEYPNIHFLLDIFVPPFRGQNIILPIAATRPSDKYIVVGAHYDSVLNSPGADDNASGVAILISLAQALSTLEVRDVNFLIVFFDHEEDGSAGSKAYLRDLQKEGKSIISMHNIDMIGWDNDKDKTIDAEFPSNEMEEIYRVAASKRGVEINRVSYNSSDHIPFREAGIETVCLSEEIFNGDTTPHYHKSSDTAETVNFEYMASTTLVVTDVMKKLARRN